MCQKRTEWRSRVNFFQFQAHFRDERRKLSRERFSCLYDNLEIFVTQPERSLVRFKPKSVFQVTCLYNLAKNALFRNGRVKFF